MTTPRPIRSLLSSRPAYALAVAALLGWYWVMAMTAVRGKTSTFDEQIHLSAGVAYWRLADYRLNPENGVLPTRWFAGLGAGPGRPQGVARRRGARRARGQRARLPLLLRQCRPGPSRASGPSPALPLRSRALRAQQVARLEGGVYCISATMLQGTYLIPEGPGGLPPPLPWRPVHERGLRQLRRQLGPLLSQLQRRGELELWLAGDAQFRKLFRIHDHLRLARLNAFLRRRAPDHMIGYSILVYRLSDRQVRLALEGPLRRGP